MPAGSETGAPGAVSGCARCHLAWRYSRNSRSLKEGNVKLDGNHVVEFPKLPELQQVTLKVIR